MRVVILLKFSATTEQTCLNTLFLQVLILKRIVQPLDDWWCVGGRMQVNYVPYQNSRVSLSWYTCRVCKKSAHFTGIRLRDVKQVIKDVRAPVMGVL